MSTKKDKSLCPDAAVPFPLWGVEYTTRNGETRILSTVSEGVRIPLGFRCKRDATDVCRDLREPGAKPVKLAMRLRWTPIEALSKE